MRRGAAACTLVELCVRALAQALAAGRVDLLEHATVWVPTEFLEKAMEAAAAASPQTITDDTLLGVMSFCGDALTELHAHGCAAVTDKSIKAACSMCPALQHVDLRGTRITEQGIIYLGKNLKTVESVWLSGCDCVSDFAMTRLLLSCKSLCHLRLRNCSKLGDDGIFGLLKHTSLTTLDLGGVARLSEEALVRVVRSNTCLTHLNLTRCCNVASDVAWNIGPRVTVRLHSNNDDEEEEEGGGEQEGCVGRRACDSWEDIDESAALHRTLGLPCLRALSLAKCSLVSDSGLSRVSFCKELEELDVSDCENITGDIECGYSQKSASYVWGPGGTLGTVHVYLCVNPLNYDSAEF